MESILAVENVASDEVEVDRTLMCQIFERWGTAIAEACKYSSVLPEFLAALIANESGGNPDKAEFDADAHRALWAVRAGAQPHYRFVTRQDLVAINDDRLNELAMAWGLTQAMGYHVLSLREPPRWLLDPASNLHRTLEVLAVYCEFCGLEPRVEYEELFRCWKAGRPDGIIGDLHYVERGLRRLVLYRELAHPGVGPLDSLPSRSETWPLREGVNWQPSGSSRGAQDLVNRGGL